MNYKKSDEPEKKSGVVSCPIQDTDCERRRHEQLLHAVNNASAVLLETSDEGDIRSSLLEGMGIIGCCVDADRVRIWQNEHIDGRLYSALQYEWLSDFGRQTEKLPVNYKFSYDVLPEWKEKISRGEYINGALSALSAEEQKYLKPLDVKAIVIIPLFLENKLWGFFSLEDCQSERIFSADEIDILRSGSLMMVSALNRGLQAERLREAHKRMRTLLDSMPLTAQLWDKNLDIVDCNEEAVRMFQAKDKQDYIRRFSDFSPEYQPDGRLSSELRLKNLKKALDEGRHVIEWMYQRRDGTEIPAEITLVKVIHGGENSIACYARDLRENRKMMQDIEYHDRILKTVNDTAAVLLHANNEDNFEESITKSMELMGRCVDVDRVHFWKNREIDGELYFVHMYQWLKTESPQGKPFAEEEMIPYSATSGWESAFLRGECKNGPVSGFPEKDQKIMEPYKVMSNLMIPLHLEDKLWGFISFDDTFRERFFTDDEVSILQSGSLMIASVVNRNMQAERIRDAHKRTQTLLDSMPLTAQLWDKNLNIIACNEEAVRILHAKNKQDYIGRFFEFLPEFQSDGRLSAEVSHFYQEKALAEGRCVFEWMYQLRDGTQLPVEVTLTRVTMDGEYFIAGYARDLREYKRMMKEIERRDSLLNLVNQTANIMLQTDTVKFESDLHSCMGMIAGALEIDRVHIWKNRIEGDQLYCTRQYRWSGGAIPQQGADFTIDIPYSDIVPGWEKTLSQGGCISGPVSGMPEADRAYLLSHGIQSIFVLPVFWRDQFWGFVGYEDCRKERGFSENEQLIMRSGGMVFAMAMLRNEMIRNVHDTAAKLGVVIANYPGIIWSVDQNNVITLFDGQHLDILGLDAGSFEGKKFNEALKGDPFGAVLANIWNDFTVRPQDLNTEVGGKTYRIRTSFVYDDSGRMTGVMGSFDDITERTRLQAELKKALEDAQKANQAKSDFLASMSHEMRTPLNAIIGLSELTLGSDELRGESYSNLEKVNNAGMTLLSIVNDILDISKIEAGKFTLIPVEYDIPSLLNDAITQSTLHINDKPIRFILDINENLPTRLYGDDLRVKQILNNLLSNAFKYTREGTVELALNCVREADTVWMTIRISDTGAGIRKDDLDKLFANYAQMDTEFNRKTEGTGLGLPITKRLVGMMDGTISVESEYGKGSTFTVRLRQKFVTGATIGSNVVSSLKNFSYSDHKRQQNSRLVRSILNYARVLVVDDVVTNLDVAKGMMKPYGMQIDCITSGQEAIDAIRSAKVKYNAVFMDHMMPGLDGIETTRIIREEIGTEYAKTVPIIALTANAILGNEKMFLDNGFQAFISKPIEIERLDAVLKEWVRDKEIEKTIAKIDVNGQLLPDIRGGQDRRTVSDRRSGYDRRTFGIQVRGIDIKKGVQRFGGDEKAFLQVLRSYAVHTRPLLEIIKGVTKDNIDKYAITVHGIKGSSRGICADIIGTKAEALEKAAKEGNFNFVTENNADFVSDVEELINNLDDMIDQAASAKPKERKNSPDREVLSRLYAACEAYNMDGVDAAMKEIEEYEYEDGLAAWLKKNVEQMNFTQIRERLSAMSD